MTYHVGIVESSKLSFLSCMVRFWICTWYLLSLNIASAFCLLNVQHIPRSVGYIENMLEQLSLRPFHWQLFIIPRRKWLSVLQLLGLIKFHITISWFGWCDRNIEAGHLRVPQQLKERWIALFQVYLFVGIPINFEICHVIGLSLDLIISSLASCWEARISCSRFSVLLGLNSMSRLSVDMSVNGIIIEAIGNKDLLPYSTYLDQPLSFSPFCQRELTHKALLP